MHFAGFRNFNWLVRDPEPQRCGTDARICSGLNIDSV